MTASLAPEPKQRSKSPPKTALRLRRLRRAELPTETVALARFLLGTILVSDNAAGRTAVRIVETEAYLPDDAAAHSFRGRTARNDSLFLRAGHAYVYFVYGMHFCMNVSSEVAGTGAGVLIRAGEPVDGLDLMVRRRPAAAPLDLARGPGRLAAALGITRAHDGLDLTQPGPLWLAAALRRPHVIATSPRIGIAKETDRILRFFACGDPYVSGPKRLRTAAPAFGSNPEPLRRT